MLINIFSAKAVEGLAFLGVGPAVLMVQGRSCFQVTGSVQ